MIPPTLLCKSAKSKIPSAPPLQNIRPLVIFIISLSKQLSDLANAAKMGGELKIKNIDSLLFKKHSVLQSKIKAANDVYQQMNSSQYKRAVTIYKKNK